MAVVLVHLSLIDDNPFQTRQEYGDLEGLAQQIYAAKHKYPETMGLMQVPRGRLIAEDDGEPVPCADFLDELQADGLHPAYGMGHEGLRVQLLYGHRRARAFQHLDEQLMPVELTDADDEMLLDAVWHENSQRKNLSEVEEAELMQAALAQHPGWSQRELAERWGMSRPTVSNRLRLLSLPEEVQAVNRSGKLSERQALALAPVVELADKLNGRGEWSEEADPRRTSIYGPPLAPQHFVDFIAEHAGEVSSDRIRDYARKQLQHAGTNIPEAVATAQLGLLDEGTLAAGVVQATCSGCPQRVQQVCLHESCLATKKEFWAEAQARAAARELDLPYSDDKEHFRPWATHAKAERLREMWEAGSCEHLVVGWCDEYYLVRPYSERSYISYIHEDEAFFGEGRRGVALGCTHAEPGACAPPQPDVEAGERDPIAERADGWREEGRAQRKQIQQRTIEALAERLYLTTTDPDGLRGLFFLWHGENADSDIHDVKKLGLSLTKHLWDRSSLITHNKQHAWTLYPKAVGLLRNCNVDAAQVLEGEATPQERLARECLRLLAYYGSERQYEYWLPKTAAKVETPLARLQTALADLEVDEGPSPDLAKLQQDLALVQAEVEAVLAAEEEE